MNISSALAHRLREVLIDGKWIANTNYREQINDLNWELANKKIGGLNSIAALVFHINYYLKGLLNVFNGGGLEIRDKYSFDMTEIASEKQWRDLVDDFFLNAKQFISAVEKMPDEKFVQHFVDEKYGDYLRNIEGVIEHCYYHLGQISLIRKILTTTPTN